MEFGKKIEDHIPSIADLRFRESLQFYYKDHKVIIVMEAPCYYSMRATNSQNNFTISINFHETENLKSLLDYCVYTIKVKQ